MKTQLIIYPALVGALLLSCAEKESDSYTDAMQDEVSTDGALVGDETNLEKLDSPEPLGQHALVDTLQLPDPLLVILSKDPATAPDKIKNVRKFTEHGTEYYEITFDNPVKEMQVVTYDNLGKIRSPELAKPNN